MNNMLFSIRISNSKGRRQVITRGLRDRRSRLSLSYPFVTPSLSVPVDCISHHEGGKIPVQIPRFTSSNFRGHSNTHTSVSESVGKSARQLRLVALGVVVKRFHLPSIDQAGQVRKVSPSSESL